MCACVLSHVWPFVTTWTVACQAPLSMELSRQEHWSGLPFPTPGDLPEPGTEHRSPALQADFYCLSHQGNPQAIIKSTLLSEKFLVGNTSFFD